MLAVSYEQIQKYVSGQYRLSAARPFEICNVMNVSVAAMFEDYCDDAFSGA